MTISQTFDLIKNMGLRYAGFRFWYTIKKKSGLFKLSFPLDPPFRSFITLDEWKKTFKFWGITREDKLIFHSHGTPDFKSYSEGYLPFFSADLKFLGMDYDWLTNPESGYKYSSSVPWWNINDYSRETGDIKYVWEKSRFAFLYDIIRHDKHTDSDHSEWVFEQISSWIKANPINSGPNYKCSQEISLRILNWTYAINYYRNSPNLTESFFNEVLNSIYWQSRHVYSNINFSRIAVRNNHAITETLTLYLIGKLYPFFHESEIWEEKGKKWFEKEIIYQIYPDGIFLQFSMNYTRVVIQLLSWAFRTADFFDDNFSDNVRIRSYECLKFLVNCQDETTGWLPNYGSNDGALFFKFTDSDFRDYRPQMNTLHILLTGEPLYKKSGIWSEDSIWYQIKKSKKSKFYPINKTEGWQIFHDGGFYILNETDTLTFIRCGNHKDRPAQADNLHMDIWYKGRNILFDGGSFKYNTDAECLKYFMGTESHNTVMLNDLDQMKKGSRFIWYNWTQAISASIDENETEYLFEGEISAFTYVDKNIRHKRSIKKLKSMPVWIITDSFINKPDDMLLKQYWHTLEGVRIGSKSEGGQELQVNKEIGWRSDYYGIKEQADQYCIVSKETIVTKISME